MIQAATSLRSGGQALWSSLILDNKHFQMYDRFLGVFFPSGKCKRVRISQPRSLCVGAETSIDYPHYSSPLPHSYWRSIHIK